MTNSDGILVIKRNSRSIANQHATQQHGHTQTPHPQHFPDHKPSLFENKASSSENNQQNFKKDWFSDMINATRNWTDVEREFQFRLSKVGALPAAAPMRGSRNMGRSGDLMAQQTLPTNQFFPFVFNLNNKEEGLFNYNTGTANYFLETFGATPPHIVSSQFKQVEGLLSGK